MIKTSLSLNAVKLDPNTSISRTHRLFLLTILVSLYLLNISRLRYYRESYHYEFFKGSRSVFSIIYSITSPDSVSVCVCVRVCVCVCLSVCLRFHWFLSDNRSPLLMDILSSNLVDRLRIPTSWSSKKKLILIARNSEQKQAYREGK